MTSGLTPLLPVAFGLLLVAVLVGGFVAEQKRRERLMRSCLARGWTYVGADDSLARRFEGDPFGRGDDRSVRNVITGTAHGRPFTAFDYSYETSSTDSRGRRSTTTHRFTVCVVPLPVPLGRVQVLPESFFSRVTSTVGLTQDIELESEAFNRRFQVQASDPKLASDVLPPRTMEYLLAAEPCAWRIEGAEVLAWEQGRMDPADVITRTAVIGRVIDGIPAFVWKDRGYDPRS
ncbi:MAG: DUF3137 domain-containing protein [Nocardioidaceae bacterium]